MTTMLVRHHKNMIIKTACALKTANALDAATLDTIVGRSVNDVKVNAPFILEMHQEADALRGVAS